MATTITVHDNPDRQRFEAYLDGALAGVAEYQQQGDALVFSHTQVEPAYEGRGVGAALAQHGLQAVRARGLQAIPACSFIAGWIRRHPELLDLVPADRRATLSR